MYPIQCPSCKLEWNIRDDVPATITCPRCLHPIQTATAPLRVLPLEHQVSRDHRASSAGIWVIVGLFLIAMIGAIRDMPGRLPTANVRALLMITGAATIALAIVGARSGRLNEVGVGAGIGVGVVASGCLGIILAGILIVTGLIAMIQGICAGLYKGL